LPGQTLWGPIFGTPGSGKTTFLHVFEKFAKRYNVRTLFIKMKDCSEKEQIQIKIHNLEKKVVKKISTILHFTASNTLKPSFDLLITSKCDSLKCLAGFAEKRFRNDVAPWITARLEVLNEYFIKDDTLVMYLCLEEFDELIKRISIGLLYALRSHIPYLLIIDDALALVLNHMYGNVWPATTRPYMASFNYFPNADETLKFDPVVISPGGRSYYKIAKKDKYIVMYRGEEWEIDMREVYALART
jgi:hypothetical protein